jgi:hypothetical protein
MIQNMKYIFIVNTIEDMNIDIFFKIWSKILKKAWFIQNLELHFFKV